MSKMLTACCAVAEEKEENAIRLKLPFLFEIVFDLSR